MRGVGGVRSNREAEKTQKGNPHNLTCRQHILPRKSIERFADKDGLVSVLFLKGSKSGKSERLPSKNDLFCAKRAWDQRSEVITKKVYEDPFQELAERIVSGETQSLGPKDNITATAFWGLWRARFLADSRNPPEYKTVIARPGIVLSGLINKPRFFSIYSLRSFDSIPVQPITVLSSGGLELVRNRALHKPQKAVAVMLSCGLRDCVPPDTIRSANS